MISGHRREKLALYDKSWIRKSIDEIIEAFRNSLSIGMSGMASGVDLFFCESCFNYKLHYCAYIPFVGQESTMSKTDADEREKWIKRASQIVWAKNSTMVEKCDTAIVVWSGTKGGTHNVFEQLIERKKNFWWINPVNKKVYYI